MSLNVTETTLDAFEARNEAISDVWMMDTGTPPKPTMETDQPEPAFETNAAKVRKYYGKEFGSIVAQFARSGVIAQSDVNAIMQSATPAIKRKLTQASKEDYASSDLFQPQINSRLLAYEDLFAGLNFVPIPRQINLELYEREMFEEDHIAGAAVDLTAVAVVKRGMKIAPYDESTPSEDEDKAEKAEKEAIQEWLDHINPIDDFRSLVKHTAAAITVTGNGYIEHLRENRDDPTSRVTGLRKVISSTMRVLKGHRGFLQWIGGKFVYFNNYTPLVNDRIAGIRKWQGYWDSRGVDPTSDAFLNSPLAGMITSEMPEGVWNPQLTEIKHFKSLHLSSVYYGFPPTYRLGKLHQLLDASLDYNISFQRNNCVPPFMVVYHGGVLTDDQKTDIQNYFMSLRGSGNHGKIPVLSAPPSFSGGTGSSAGKTGIEIVKVAGEGGEGIFLNLWGRVIKDMAMNFHLPLDFLTTENSNRATITVAEQIFNDFVVNEFHETFESWLKWLTKYDNGWERNGVHFESMDTDDRLDLANEAQLYHGMGALNPNEIRADYLHKTARPGGEQFWEGQRMPAAEDESAEEAGAESARVLMLDPAKRRAAEALGENVPPDVVPPTAL